MGTKRYALSIHTFDTVDNISYMDFVINDQLFLEVLLEEKHYLMPQEIIKKDGNLRLNYSTR